MVISSDPAGERNEQSWTVWFGLVFFGHCHNLLTRHDCHIETQSKLFIQLSDKKKLKNEGIKLK